MKVIVKSNLKNKAVFFDRDGVINKLIKRDSGLYSPRKVKDFNFYSDIEKCVSVCIENNFLIIIVSNQPDISRKKMDILELKKINKLIRNKLHIDAIYYSFDDVYFEGGLKKPSPIMVFNAQKEWNINLAKSLFLGDSNADFECAKNAGVNFVLVKRDHNKDLLCKNVITDLTKIDRFLND
jgi:D-glycero-D-manno-heptose 1,7-bisphosphate phosphatase